jgi:flagellar basal-body rod protein FlgF
MIRGVYASASGLDALLRRQEAMSQNLANLNTPGFKQELSLLQDWADSPLVAEDAISPDPAIGALPTGVNGSELRIDYSQGPLETTGRSLDVAILGDGFFRVQTPQGERLTRDGSFHRDSSGHLVTADGNFLLGDNGPIQIGEGSPSITEDGNIYLPGATGPAARISLVRADDPAGLVREADNLLAPGTAALQPLAPGATNLKQGLLEQANVDVSAVMVTMMMALRSYESVQRSLKMQDETIQRLMEITRLA